MPRKFARERKRKQRREYFEHSYMIHYSLLVCYLMINAQYQQFCTATLNCLICIQWSNVMIITMVKFVLHKEVTFPKKFNICDSSYF